MSKSIYHTGQQVNDMVFCQETMDHSLQVELERLPEVRVVQYSGFLLTSEGRMEWEVVAAPGIKWVLFQSVKRELSVKAKRLISRCSPPVKSPGRKPKQQGCWCKRLNWVSSAALQRGRAGERELPVTVCWRSSNEDVQLVGGLGAGPGTHWRNYMSNLV